MIGVRCRLPVLEEAAFGMPEEWLAAKVGQPLKHEIHELQRRMAVLLSAVEEGELEWEEGERLRRQLEHTEDVVLQQDRVSVFPL